jgi:hypothetical protein
VIRSLLAPQMLIASLLAVAAMAPESAAQKDLPYVAVHDPQFISASDANFLNSDDRVIGLMDGDVAKAYPAGILWQHGMVEDNSKKGPIAITWCAYCNTAIVFKAEANGKPLTLDVADTAGGNEVFKDQETGSRWQQAGLNAISGPLQGEHLQLYPSLLTSWAEWQRLHPGTLVLKPLPGYAERIGAVNKFVKQGGFGASPVPDGVRYRDERLKPKAMVLGLNLAGANKAYPLDALRTTLVLNDSLGGTPLVIVHQPPTDTTTAFGTKVGARTLTFAASNADGTELIDHETKSRWNAYGECVSGRLKGSKLEPIILQPGYWFAWSEFHRDSVIYAPQ